MKTTITTTITTTVDIDTFAVDHEVHINVEDDVPQEIASAIVVGAAKALINNLDPEGKLDKGDSAPETGDAEF